LKILKNDSEIFYNLVEIKMVTEEIIARVYSYSDSEISLISDWSESDSDDGSLIGPIEYYGPFDIYINDTNEFTNYWSILSDNTTRSLELIHTSFA